jgi:proteasome lid subunit RPN8/RPN11
VDSVIRIRPKISTGLRAQAQQSPAVECCGLLAGRGGVITHLFPAENVAADRDTSYEIAPREICRLMREFRAAGLEFLAIYHSHPKGENRPSPRDVELAYYAQEAYFIVSPRPDLERPVRAFSIRDGCSTELEIEEISEAALNSI